MIFVFLSVDCFYCFGDYIFAEASCIPISRDQETIHLRFPTQILLVVFTTGVKLWTQSFLWIQNRTVPDNYRGLRMASIYIKGGRLSTLKDDHRSRPDFRTEADYAGVPSKREGELYPMDR